MPPSPIFPLRTVRAAATAAAAHSAGSKPARACRTPEETLRGGRSHVPTSAVPTSATGKIAACGLEHIVAPRLQRKKQLDYELTTSSRSRAVSTAKAANASSRPASSQTRGWHRERARPTSRHRAREVRGEPSVAAQSNTCTSRSPRRNTYTSSDLGDHTFTL